MIQHAPHRCRIIVRFGIVTCLTVVFSGLTATRGEAATPTVIRTRTPHGGIQPQAAIDGRGVLHLIYFKGDPAAGDLYYVRRRPGQAGLSPPVRVNSQPGSAIAVGTIRGGQIAVGKDGRAHVAWNGSGQALPKGPAGGSPMLYARLNAAGTAFEPQRNLMQFTRLLDGGGSVAADGEGNVYVAWHAAADTSKSESDRRLWMARSNDNGRTFSRETPAYAKSTGACACCATRAFTDNRGTVYVLYRAAAANVDRDMVLLASSRGGARFRGKNLHPWKINTCPMSSMSFAEGPRGVTAAWETNGQVFFARVDPATLGTSPPIPTPGAGTDRKHPAVAVNTRGETVLVWTEGTGWQRGGALAWQVFDPAGRPTRLRGRVERSIPVWGLATVHARPDGSFEITH